jgi:hypothetical protein
LLIAEGRRSFFNDTFQGNGRTCGTCHREDNNLTIDPAFIATLPPNDPLFVAEFVPALAVNFENPVLMRQVGLILENVDGFGDLSTKFAMRGVPHTLALIPNTLKPAELDGTHPPFVPVAPFERTGWSGDGAPAGGTLREFIIGAVTQHYPKTLNRIAGSDFILPTVAQLDSLEAFQKSTGRLADLDTVTTNKIRLKGEAAARGMGIFNDPGFLPPLFNGPVTGAGRCLLCHFNGGSGDFFESVLLTGNTDPAIAHINGFVVGNANFNTGVENIPNQPADALVPPSQNPPDGGFGQAVNPTGGLGDGTFNTPVLVEAADTPPFFHNNSVNTIEDAVRFYTTPAFTNSTIGALLPGGISLNDQQINDVAAFLRVVNALENIRSSKSLLQRAVSASSGQSVIAENCSGWQSPKLRMHLKF